MKNERGMRGVKLDESISKVIKKKRSTSSLERRKNKRTGSSNGLSGDKKKCLSGESCDSVVIDAPETIFYLCVLEVAIEEDEPFYQNWSMLDASEISNQKNLPHIAQMKMPRDCPMEYSTCVVGSKIYAFGGVEDPCDPESASRRVFVFDTSSLKKNKPQWKELDGMIVPRRNPAVVAANGEIYVIGSTFVSLEKVNPWAEVFSPSTGKWSEFLKTPPLMLGTGDEGLRTAEANFALLRNHRTILTNISMGSTYYVKIPMMSTRSSDHSASETNCPQVPPHEITYGCRNPASIVLVNDVLYAFDYAACSLVAFELLENRTCPVSGMEDALLPLPENSDVFLFHRGNKHFCLIWSSPLEEDTSCEVHCLRFRVERIQYDLKVTTSPWYASVDGHDVHTAQGAYVSHCVAMQSA